MVSSGTATTSYSLAPKPLALPGRHDLNASDWSSDSNPILQLNSWRVTNMRLGAVLACCSFYTNDVQIRTARF